ncbi:MAG: universal stress protein [Sulfurimonas sp.]|uniref:universal stress protein n=1 Tax=Sulfurimonas sp. TaxID=2022749 RepID=UPI0025D46A85|nr:universal stress protein [Sulfurimonas sp.]MCK9491879.1 universal stress protein [Sulfurimonas sp.]
MQNINDINEAIFACVDGSKFSEAVCDYALEIAEQLKLPLVLLNTIEHPNISSITNLSGNLILGEREDLLEDLSEEDAVKNKETRTKGKELLSSLKAKVLTKGYTNVITLQRHGTLYENLKDFEDKLRVVLFGVSGMGSLDEEMEIGAGVEDIIRDIDAPIILINKDYTPIKKVMIAFNGASGSVRALEEVSASPMFAKEIKRYIVTVDKNIQKAQDLSHQAKDLIQDLSLNCEYISKEGEALESILDSIATNDIDILAIGSYSHGKIKSALFGSFTTKLIKNVKIPLIVLK